MLMNIFLYVSEYNNIYIDYINYIIYLFTKNNFEVKFYKINQYHKIDDLNINNGNLNIFIPLHFCFIRKQFINNFTNQFKLKNNYMINTEQVTKKNCMNKIKYMIKYFKIIDYSKQNIFLSKLKIYHLQFLYYQDYPKINKTNEICMIGVNTKRRRDIFNNLLKINKNAKNITGYGISRDTEVLSYKILVNCHANILLKILEEIRINQFVLNKVIIISEGDIKENNELYLLKDHIIFCSYDKIIETVKDVYDNYDKYYNKLFKNFDINNIIKFQNNQLKNITNELI